MILVFGGNGQLGQELVRASAARQVPLVALDRAQADIADPAAVRAAIAQHRPALVVNAAAYTKVDLAETETEAARRGNEDRPAVLVGACAAPACRWSTSRPTIVFDGAKTGAYVEDDPVAPLERLRAEQGRGRAARCARRRRVT